MGEKRIPRRRGQVEDLGCGSYRVRVPLGTRPDGSRPYHNETLHNSTEAKAWKRVTALLGQVDSGTYFSASKQTVGELMTECLDRARRRGCKRGTLRFYETLVENHIKPALGDFPIGQLTADVIQKFPDGMQDAGMSARYARVAFRLLRSALNYAVARNRLRSNPCMGVELPPAQKPRKARVFESFEEAVRFVEACRQEPDDIILVLGLVTGMRPSEFTGVAYPHLSLVRGRDEDGRETERGMVSIEQAVARAKGGGWYFETPKTPASRRKVYFPASLYYELMARKPTQLERLRLLGLSHQLVFTNALGNPFPTSTLRRRLLKVCERAGIDTKGRTSYTLRRSHATLSLLANERLKSLSERMGHTSVEFTQDEYIDTLPEMQQFAADKLERGLLGTNLAQGESERVM